VVHPPYHGNRFAIVSKYVGLYDVASYKRPEEGHLLGSQL